MTAKKVIDSGASLVAATGKANVVKRVLKNGGAFTRQTRATSKGAESQPRGEQSHSLTRQTRSTSKETNDKRQEGRIDANRRQTRSASKGTNGNLQGGSSEAYKGQTQGTVDELQLDGSDTFSRQTQGTVDELQLDGSDTFSRQTQGTVDELQLDGSDTFSSQTQGTVDKLQLDGSDAFSRQTRATSKGTNAKFNIDSSDSCERRTRATSSVTEDRRQGESGDGLRRQTRRTSRQSVCTIRRESSVFPGTAETKGENGARSKGGDIPDEVTRQTRSKSEEIAGRIKENNTFARQTRATSREITDVHGLSTGVSKRQTRVTYKEASTSEETEMRCRFSSCTSDVGQINEANHDSSKKASQLKRKARKDTKTNCYLPYKKRSQVAKRPRLVASGSDRLMPGKSTNRDFENAPPPDDGWTTDEEIALQDAYSTIKPAANFWHLISKRVPGRSAAECFNKFYCAYPTPPRAAQRSCVKEINSPLSPSDPPKAKSARGKQRLLEAHRRIRCILRRQQTEDEDYEEDAFAEVEHPDVVDSVVDTEDGLKADKVHNTRGVRRVSLAASRPDTSRKTDVEKRSRSECPSNKENGNPNNIMDSRKIGDAVSSSEVLKKVKDPAQLDKYIDHLLYRHSRKPKKTATQKSRSSNLFSFWDTTRDAVERAKQALRDVLTTSGRPRGELLGITVSNSDDEEDDDSGDSQMSPY